MMRAHGSYISDVNRGQQRVFTYICNTTEESVSETILDSAFLNREERQAEARDLGNKNWLIFKVAHEAVFVFYNHDGRYSVYSARAADLCAFWKREIGAYKVDSPYRLFIEGMITRIEDAMK